MARILILGGGFSGLIAAEELAGGLDRSHQITIVAPSPKFTFYPGLVHLAMGECGQDDITFDLTTRAKELGARFVKGEVIEINADRSAVQVSGDDIRGEIEYDFLILAFGRRLATQEIDGFFEYAHHLLGTKAALKFGEAVESFQGGQIVVGLCPDGRLPVPVCETAFALSRKFAADLESGKTKISVIFPESLQSAFGGASLHKDLESAFSKFNIKVHYDIPISAITQDQILSLEKHSIAYDLAMLVPPFRGHVLLRELGITDDHDFVNVDAAMRVVGLKHAYAAGDIVAFSGPKLAHMAVRQAKVAASNLVSELTGKEPQETYFHEIATIIDTGGSDSIYLHYGIWDQMQYRLKKGTFWSVAKNMHDSLWQARHK